MVFTTDNNILVNCLEEEPALMCAQRNAAKTVPTEEELVASNISGFGDDIGKITNRATSMFNVRAQFEPGSKEYEVLSYRIRASQHYQQCSIGFICGLAQ